MYRNSNMVNLIISCCLTDKNVAKKILKIINRNISIENQSELRREL